jgi:multicomponent Na+:H+ antiporter subunit A
VTLTSLVLIPVILTVALILVPALVRLLDRDAGWPLAALFTALVVWIIADPDLASGVIDGRTVSWSTTWLPDVLPGGGDVSLALRLDGLSLFFVLLALVIGAAVFAYSARYLHRTTEDHGDGVMSFYVLMTAFMASVVLLFLADDVTVLFIAWELVSLASFFLIARAGRTGEPGAMRTLLLTFTGGLSLLVALGIAVATTGTTSLSGIIASDAWGEDAVRTGIVAALIALAGFSKAAQFPFHAWLPEAMAAITPVSAFLHAAAVVKAGIYLLMRFSGAFHEVTVWNLMLIISGMFTAVMAAVFAIQKPDLKKLTAYSTVSQLGWIVATIGVGTPVALAAAVVHTAAHALFKSSLFMIIGVIDHQAGSRDLRDLGVLWRKMPWTFSGAVVAAACMAGLPPTLGFVSKEGMLGAFEEAPVGTAGQIVLLTAAGIGAVATLLYSAKYVLGAFIDGRPIDPDSPDGAERVPSPSTTPDDEVREASPVFWLPAVLPAFASIPAVCVLAFWDDPLDAVVSATGMTGADAHHSHLAFWHGWTVPLGITAAVIVVGVALLFARHRIFPAMERRHLLPFTGAGFISLSVQLANRWGRLANRPGNSLNPTRHLIWIFAMVLLLAGAAFLDEEGLHQLGSLPPRVDGIDQIGDLAGLAMVMLVVIAIISTRSRFGSVILVGIAGAAVSWIMLTLGAPDVALTNLMVEFVVTVFLMLIVRHQPRLYLREGENRAKFSIVSATIVGLIVFIGSWLLIGRHGRPELAMWYLENGPEESGANNIVASIIVEFRGFDTLGELCVLGMAGIVIAAVVNSVPRSPVPGYGPGSSSELFRRKGTTKFPDVHNVPELAPFYSRYLRSTYLNSVLGRMVMWPMAVVLVIYSAAVFWRGHQSPGGGFLAALILALGIVFWYLVQPASRTVGGKNLGYYIIGSGMLLALGTGLIGYLASDGAGFLTPIHGHIGSEHVTTSLVFDAGVYLAVIGTVIVVVNTLGGRNRPGADPSRTTKAAPVETGATAAQPAMYSVSETFGGSSVPLHPAAVRKAREAAEKAAAHEPSDTSGTADTTEKEKDQ